MYAEAGDIILAGDPRSDQVRGALAIRSALREMAATLNEMIVADAVAAELDAA